MNRIDGKFSLLKKNGEKGLIPFITAGDTDMATTEALVLTMEENGADLIELGVPFSDPIADGPVIQKAYLRSLRNGISLRKIIELVDSIRKKTQVPLILMSSYNPVFYYNTERFVADAVSAGVDGVIIPDLPPEEGKELRMAAEKSGLNIIFLVAPTSKHERIKYLCSISKGFVYYISLTGVTGERKNLVHNMEKKLTEIKKISQIPVAVGFGISKPEHVEAAGKIADGVIVGSAIVKVIESNINDRTGMIKKVGSLVSTLKQGCMRAQNLDNIY